MQQSELLMIKYSWIFFALEDEFVIIHLKLLNVEFMTGAKSGQIFFFSSIAVYEDVEIHEDFLTKKLTAIDGVSSVETLPLL